MDNITINNSLISSGITAGVYLIYKGIKRYYIKSQCHSERHSIEIAIIDSLEAKEEEKKKEEPEQKEIEMIKIEK
jgi:hypothetical protein